MGRIGWLIGLLLVAGCDGGPAGPDGEQVSEMVLIPAGTFTMGVNDYGPDEGPAHTVFLDAFWIDRFEATNGSYLTFAQETGRSLPGSAQEDPFVGPDQPASGVTWFDAQAYCQWAGKRLCTEAEWEKAARGADDRLYPWGGEAPDADRLNFNSHVGRTAPVGSYETGRSPFGIYDMAGNVWEWVADRYRADAYRTSTFENPQGPDSGALRVMRGGCWFNGAAAVRVAERGRLAPERMGLDIGVRCCRGGQ